MFQRRLIIQFSNEFNGVNRKVVVKIV